MSGILYLEKRSGGFALLHESGALHSLHADLISALESARAGSWPVFYLGEESFND